MYDLFKENCRFLILNDNMLKFSFKRYTIRILSVKLNICTRKLDNSAKKGVNGVGKGRDTC